MLNKIYIKNYEKNGKIYPVLTIELKCDKGILTYKYFINVGQNTGKFYLKEDNSNEQNK